LPAAHHTRRIVPSSDNFAPTPPDAFSHAIWQRLRQRRGAEKARNPPAI